jgi:hypothetical protein
MPDDAPTRFQRIANWFDGLRKVAVGIAATIVAVIVIAAIVRELLMGGIAIDPVVVKASDSREAPTPELAAQQIAGYLDRVQHAGVDEWRKAHVDDGTHDVDLQIPGAPLSLRNAAHEIVALFGLAPKTLRSAISRRTPAGYTAVVSLDGDHGSIAVCEEKEDGPNVLDRIYECIARNAIAFADPKVAAAYVFQRERDKCQGLDAGMAPQSPALEREELGIKNRRELCSFTETQQLIARVMNGGQKGDLPWVPYIYGQVHMARAEALRQIGLQERLSEFDQAIGRFLDSRRLLPDSPTAVAVLMEAYLSKGIAIHESTAMMPWDDDPASVLQFRLRIAEQTLADAERQLAALGGSHSRRLDGLVNRHEGLLQYRTWMIAAHRRTKSGQLTVALGQDGELALLAKALEKFEAAEAKTSLSPMDFMHWGNVARAAGKYDLAVAKYRRAADLMPTNSDPALNIAVAYLDRVQFAPKVAGAGDVVVALGALSDYLAWMTGGGPYDLLIPKVRRALARTGDAEDASAFGQCLDKVLASDPATDPDIEKWRAAGAFKFCVDAAIKRVDSRTMRAAKGPSRKGP